MTKRARATGRAEGGSYINLTHAFLQHPNFLETRAPAVKLFMYLAGQFRGHNNAELSASFTTMERLGWRSRSSLAEAIDELVVRRLIVMTRRGARRGKCHLFALTCKPINDSEKSDFNIKASPVAGNEWKLGPDPVEWEKFEARWGRRSIPLAGPNDTNAVPLAGPSIPLAGPSSPLAGPNGAINTAGGIESGILGGIQSRQRASSNNTRCSLLADGAEGGTAEASAGVEP